MSWFQGHRRNAVLVGLTVLLPALLVLKSLGGLAAVGIGYAQDRARIEPRVARLQGLLDQASLLEERSAVAVARLREVAHGPEQDSSALAAALQADVRQIMDSAGLDVTNSQVMPVRRDESFEHVAVKLTISGSLPALNSALMDIAAFRPLLLVESLDAFPARGQRRAGAKAASTQNVTAVLQVMTLRQVPL